jgi:hypothetical protein
MKMDIKKNIKDHKQVIIAGAGIGAVAAAVYFLASTKSGSGNKKKMMKGWMIRMRGEVIERLENLREVTEPVYEEIVDTVAQAQIVSDRIPRKEIMDLADDLKRDWKAIAQLAKGEKPKLPPKKRVRASTTKKANGKSGSNNGLSG